MRKVISIFLAVGLAAMAVPLAAQDYAPDTIWGDVPAGVANAAKAVLQDSGGRVIATVPVVNGKFVFLKVPPGPYNVVLQDGAGKGLATSHAISFATAGTVKAQFDVSRVAGAVTSGGGGGGGLSTTAWVLIGAAGLGIATAIVIASNNDEGNASPTR